MKLALPLTLFLVFHPSQDFRVNTTTTTGLYYPAVAASAIGEFVVAWTDVDNPGDNGTGIYARRFDRHGGPLTPVFHVNTYTTDIQIRPSVAMDPYGSFVVTWDSVAQDGDMPGVFARRYDAAGAPRGNDFRVNTATTGIQQIPSVATDPSGAFFVVYEGEDGNESGVVLSRFLGSGTPVGTEFLVNGTTTGWQQEPVVAADSSGAFVIAWGGMISGGVDGYDLVAHRFGPNGTLRGGDFRVNTGAGHQGHPAISVNPAGGFVLAWSTTNPALPGTISARAYRANGQAQTGEIAVSAYPTAHLESAVLSLPDGGFLVAYSGYTSPSPPSSLDILLRQFDASGSPVGGEFVVNTYTTGVQSKPRIAGHPRGFVVVWESARQDGSDSQIYARTFSTLPVPGDVDGDGDVALPDVFYLINFLFAGGPAPID